jgi:hypothetical protein
MRIDTGCDTVFDLALNCPWARGMRVGALPASLALVPMSGDFGATGAFSMGLHHPNPRILWLGVTVVAFLATLINEKHTVGDDALAWNHILAVVTGERDDPCRGSSPF